MVKLPNKIEKFKPSTELLRNPGKGFTTFQRFRGDALNEEAMGEPWCVENGWRMERYEENDGLWRGYGVAGYPDTSLAYFRIPWRRLEPCRGEYDFSLIDMILSRAKKRLQTVIFRFPPHSARPDDLLELPEWIIEELGLSPREIGDKSSPICDFFFDRYASLIRKIGKHINGDPTLEAVDVSVVSAWGEGAQMNELDRKYKLQMADAYTDAFTDTVLLSQFNDTDFFNYISEKRPVGLRADCLGDMKWSHMTHLYPRAFAELPDVWKRAPIAFEVCWVMKHWQKMGWDIDFTIEESLRWHISSFNEKSVYIPDEYKEKVEEWIKRMGYRFAVRFSEYPQSAAPGDILKVNIGIENRGVAPIYRRLPVIIRLKGASAEYKFTLRQDITEWLPGNYILEEELPLPENAERGEYKLELGITNGETDVLIATEAPRDGAYTIIGSVTVK